MSSAAKTDSQESGERLSSWSDAGLRLAREAGSLLAPCDQPRLRKYLRTRWSPSALAAQLEHRDPDVVRIAAVCLGLVGRFDQSAALSKALHHDDYFVVCLAESALRSIWFRASRASCRRWLRSAIEQTNRCDYAQAAALLDRILDTDRDFAEACNQRAAVYYLTGRFERSIIDCQRALMLNPHHFWAVTTMAYSQMRLGNCDIATDLFLRVLDMHPRLEGIRQALRCARLMASSMTPRSAPPAPVRFSDAVNLELAAGMPAHQASPVAAGSGDLVAAAVP